ncbi:MAG: hypothetical protein AB8B72_12295 [Crocinitomicaceae bacterium]
MEKTIIKSLVLLLSIPLINLVANTFKFSSQLMYESISTLEQFEAYQFSTIFIVVTLVISVPLIEGLYDVGRINNLMASLLYLLSFSIIAIVTSDQFTFHLDEHIIIFLSVVSIIFTREVMNRKVIGDIQFA